MKNIKIACIGNAAYDYVVSGDEFIKEGVRNSFYDVVFSAGGPASNAASVLARFGNQVDFYGQVGADENGRYILNQMNSEKINTRNLHLFDKVMTPFSFVIINRSKNTRTICSLRSKADYTGAKIHDAEFKDDYDFILTDGKYVEDSIELINKNPKAISIIDAGRSNAGVIEVCNNVDYIICSEDFANAVTSMELSDDVSNNERVYRKLKEKFSNAKGIAITVGKKGYICEENSEVVNYYSYDSGLKAIDTNCAGDIFHGAFTHALANGYSYKDSLSFANITASLSTTKQGGRDSCPELNVVEDIMRQGGEKLVKKIRYKANSI